jgi:hypothetical protein
MSPLEMSPLEMSPLEMSPLEMLLRAEGARAPRRRRSDRWRTRSAWPAPTAWFAPDCAATLPAAWRPPETRAASHRQPLPAIGQGDGGCARPASAARRTGARDVRAEAPSLASASLPRPARTRATSTLTIARSREFHQRNRRRSPPCRSLTRSECRRPLHRTKSLVRRDEKHPPHMPRPSRSRQSGTRPGPMARWHRALPAARRCRSRP